jgi:hypothetical protein
VGHIGEGTPDATWEPIPCGEYRVIDFGEPIQIDSLVFYEFFNPEDGCGQPVNGQYEFGICMDELQILLSNTPPPDDFIPSGGEVFYWGDNDVDNNGLIFPYHHRTSNEQPEIDNEGIPWVELFPSHETDPQWRTGVCVNVNATDRYRYLIFYAPYNSPPPGLCNDQPEIDSFEINVDLDACPVPTGAPRGPNLGPR